MGKGPFFDFDKEKLELCKNESSQLLDKHYDNPKIEIPINWVGIVNQQYFVPTVIDSHQFTLNALFEAHINLPQNMRGLNISRCNEAIIKVISNKKKNNDIAQLPSLCAKELLYRHEYSDISRVNISFDYPYSDTTPTGIKTHEFAKVMIGAEAKRCKSKICVINNICSVKIGGVLACPLSLSLLQKDSEKILIENGIDKQKASIIVKKMPIGTHMEHSFSHIKLTIPASESEDFKKLLKIVRESIGQPFIEILKRTDERNVLKKLLNAESCLFAEDVVRMISKRIAKEFAGLHPDSFIEINQESLFTFSHFTIKAQKLCKLSELFNEFSNK